MAIFSRTPAALCGMACLLATACDPTPEEVAVCENVVVRPSLHAPDSYERLSYSLVAVGGGATEIRISFRSLDPKRRWFREDRTCTFPRAIAGDEAKVRAHMAALAEEREAEAQRRRDRFPDLRRAYEDGVERRTQDLLEATDEEGKQILRELHELMTIKKEPVAR
jgi:hypothetical protein